MIQVLRSLLRLLQRGLQRDGCSSTRARAFFVVPGCPVLWLLRHRGPSSPQGSCWHHLLMFAMLGPTAIFCKVLSLYPLCSPVSPALPQFLTGTQGPFGFSSCFAWSPRGLDTVSGSLGHTALLAISDLGPRKAPRECLSNVAGQGAHLRHLWCTEKPRADPAA